MKILLTCINFLEVAVADNEVEKEEAEKEVAERQAEEKEAGAEWRYPGC